MALNLGEKCKHHPCSPAVEFNEAHLIFYFMNRVGTEVVALKKQANLGMEILSTAY